MGGLKLDGDREPEAPTLASYLLGWAGNDPMRGEVARAVGAIGFHTAPPENYFIERFAAAYRAEMGAFVAMLKTGAPPLAGIRDGLEAQRIAEAAIVSMQAGQPVGLSPDWRPKPTR